MPTWWRWFGFFLAVLGVSFSPTRAWASTREVCLEFAFADERFECAESGWVGNLRGCTKGEVQNPVGHVFEVWDKDTGMGATDDYLGTWVVGGSGRRCLTFEWEEASVSRNEPNPDVYVRYVYKSRQTGCPGCTRAVMQTMGGHDVAAASWRDGPSGDADRWVASNCEHGAPCDIRPGKALIPTLDVSCDAAILAELNDTMQHGMQVFNDALSENNISVRYPIADSGSQYDLNYRIYVPQGQAETGESAPHELGHLVQQEQLGLAPSTLLLNKCGADGDGGHIWNETEAESCATTEGWAGFAAAAAWYDTAESGLGAAALGSHDYESPIAVVPDGGDDNGRVEAQVARAFWDAADAADEDGLVMIASTLVPSGFDDQDNLGALALALGWSTFAAGTENRENREQDSSTDNDGVNLRDYLANAEAEFGTSTLFETLLEHNFLTSQDDD